MLSRAQIKRLHAALKDRYPGTGDQLGVYDDPKRDEIEYIVHELSHAAVFGLPLDYGSPVWADVHEIFKRLHKQEKFKASDEFEAHAIAIEWHALRLLKLPVSKLAQSEILHMVQARHYDTVRAWHRLVRDQMKTSRSIELANQVVQAIGVY
jgi:hypothetical protein